MKINLIYCYSNPKTIIIMKTKLAKSQLYTEVDKHKADLLSSNKSSLACIPQ